MAHVSGENTLMYTCTNSKCTPLLTAKVSKTVFDVAVAILNDTLQSLLLRSMNFCDGARHFSLTAHLAFTALYNNENNMRMINGVQSAKTHRRVNTPTDPKNCNILFYGGFMLGWV